MKMTKPFAEASFLRCAKVGYVPQYIKTEKNFVEERSLQNKLERITNIYEGDYLTKFSLSFDLAAKKFVEF